MGTIIHWLARLKQMNQQQRRPPEAWTPVELRDFTPWKLAYTLKIDGWNIKFPFSRDVVSFFWSPEASSPFLKFTPCPWVSVFVRYFRTAKVSGIPIPIIPNFVAFFEVIWIDLTAFSKWGPRLKPSKHHNHPTAYQTGQLRDTINRCFLEKGWWLTRFVAYHIKMRRQINSRVTSFNGFFWKYTYEFNVTSCFFSPYEILKGIVS